MNKVKSEFDFKNQMFALWFDNSSAIVLRIVDYLICFAILEKTNLQQLLNEERLQRKKETKITTIMLPIIAGLAYEYKNSLKHNIRLCWNVAILWKVYTLKAIWK